MIVSIIHILFALTAGLSECLLKELDASPSETWVSNDNINTAHIRIKRHDEANGYPSHSRVSEQIRNILLENYSPVHVPDSVDGTKVSLGIYIVDFDSVNSADMSITMKFYLRQSWIDKRLVFDWETIQSWNETTLPHLTPKDIPEQFNIVPITQFVRETLFLPDTYFT